MSDPFRTLYKFWSLRSQHGREAIHQALAHSRLWWASPSTFNDPYDCRPRLQYEASRLKREALARAIIKGRDDRLPPAEKRARILQAARRNPRDFVLEMQDAADGWINESSVCCFTRDPSNLLMWGHYADSHRGVGLVFSEVGGDDHWVAYEVAYTDERPTVDFGSDRRGELFVEDLLKKATSWSYEFESRMIEYRQPEGYRAFPRPCLLGVLLGSRISLEDEYWVRAEVARYRPHIFVRRASLSATEYRIEIEQPG